jgi:formylglycine-generating enzyme required for sulfatase activity
LSKPLLNQKSKDRELLELREKIQFLESDRDDNLRQTIRMLDDISYILNGNLQTQCDVVTCDCLLRNIIDNFNLLVSELDEAVSQLSPDHQLFKKYKLNKSVFITNSIKFEFVYVRGGNFLMGSSLHNSESPIHEVTLEDFWLGKYPVTQQQYLAIMGENPSHFKGEDLPVDSVSWHDAQEFCKAFSQSIGKSFSLPSEAQWEYAATRKGNDYFLDLMSYSHYLKKFAWFNENSDNTSHSVYSKNCNGVGAYGMNGNIWEWCEDSWHPNYNGAPCDGSAWVSDELIERVLRGGCWNSDEKACLSTSRHRHNSHNSFSNCGFRIVWS